MINKLVRFLPSRSQIQGLYSNFSQILFAVNTGFLTRYVPRRYATAVPGSHSLFYS